MGEIESVGPITCSSPGNKALVVDMEWKIVIMNGPAS